MNTSIQTYAISSLPEMQALGEKIGVQLIAGDVLSLNGELGAGKTALTRGIGLTLRINDVTSPTFVISKIYPGTLPLIHVDAYRLIGENLAVIDDLDLETRIPTSVTVIEWGKGYAERLSAKIIDISIDFGLGPDDRIVTINGLDR
jgi:tRNA threonylcarbamoyladenosine biosynthesis protein TsaE